MADPQQNYRDVLSRLEAKDKEGTSVQDLYDAASFLPGTGEAIAAYELPGILSQGGQMMQSDDVLEALKGMGLVTLGTASVAPGIGPIARKARKGLEGFIPYMGPKPAMAGGPDTSIMAMTDFEPPKGGAKAAEDIGLGSGSLFAPETKKGRQLLVLSCSSTKCPDVGDMKAVDRYLGPVFQSLKKQGVPDNVDVAILSAKHGLIRADTKIKDYDQLMDTNRASEFKQDAGQMDRIKNTLEGYDKVVVQGGKNYKDVIRAASGDANVTEIPGGRGIGDQRKSVKSALAFSKIDTPVYHFTRNTDPGFTKFDPNKLSFFDLGPHVGSTPRAAQDRFLDEIYGVGTRKKIRDTMQETGQSRDEVLATLKLPQVSGNVGYDPITNRPIARKTLGGSLTLKADLSKPFLNPKTGKPFTEMELNDYQAEQYSIHKGEYISSSDIMGEDPKIDIQDVKKFMRAHSKGLAELGFTHIPYENAVEGVGDLSYVMLVNRPKGSTKVLQSPFAKKDPDKFDDPDFMMEEGGVVSMKDRAVNINRGPRGIEPFVQYFDSGGVVQTVKDYIGSFFRDEPTVERNIFEEQRAVAERAKQDEIVQEGIDRFQAGLMMDRSFQGDDFVDRKMKRKEEYAYGNYFDPTVKDVIDEYYVLPDDVYVRKPKGAATYRSGVEFGDVELGFDLLNKMKFNPVLQAGLRDNRSLSDYVKYMKSGDPRARDIMGPGVMGSYNPSSNLIFLEALPRGENILPDKSEATLVHELMHKGAELLKRDRNIDLSFFKNQLESKAPVIANESEEIKAEHRYLQSLVNTAYMEDLLEKSSRFGNKILGDLNKQLQKATTKDEIDKIFFQIGERKKDIKDLQKRELLDEANRVFNLYFTDDRKRYFREVLKSIYNMDMVDYTGGSRIDYDYKFLRKMYLNDAIGIYNFANTIMAEEAGTKKFKEEIEKAGVSPLTSAYSIYFPKQIDSYRTDQVDEYVKFEKDFRNRMKKKYGENFGTRKAEGGVIGLKDKAVNMYRNRL